MHESDGHSDAPRLATDDEGNVHLVYAESPTGAFERYQLYYIVGGIWLFQLIVSPIWMKHFESVLAADEHYPPTMLALNGVDFEKGCYVGQENTARMHYRNKVNRRIVVVPLDQADDKRQRCAYPDLGLSVEHRRVEDLDGIAVPDWLAAAIAPA